MPYYQTPRPVAEYMASLLPENCGTILEPTPGEGNLLKAAMGKGTIAYYPDFDQIPRDLRFDYAIMNPPFTPMSEGYRWLKAVMVHTDKIIVLLPWFILINSDSRTTELFSYGIRSVTHLPRKTFPNCRIQCCIIELYKGYEGNTFLRNFKWPVKPFEIDPVAIAYQLYRKKHPLSQ